MNGSRWPLQPTRCYTLPDLEAVALSKVDGLSEIILIEEEDV